MTTSRLGGSFEWMHTLGFGDLGDPDEEVGYGAAQTTGSIRRSAQQAAGQDDAVPAGPSAGAAPGAGAATQCAKCGQLAFVAGTCQCEIEVEE